MDSVVVPATPSMLGRHVQSVCRHRHELLEIVAMVDECRSGRSLDVRVDCGKVNRMVT
jgi:hypothetical protein